jgi:hypothetical protein
VTGFFYFMAFSLASSPAVCMHFDPAAFVLLNSALTFSVFLSKKIVSFVVLGVPV